MSLGRKVAGVLALAIILSGVTVSAFGTYRMRNLLIEQKLDSSLQISRSLASSALPDILNNDFVALQDSTDQILAYDSEHEIVFVGIFDSEGKPLVRSSRSGDNLAPPEGENVRRVTVPITFNDRNFGHVDLYFSLDRIESEVLGTIVSLGSILAFVVIVAAVLMALLAYSVVVKPVVRLGRSAREISEGNLDLEIPVNSGDEIGRLSEDFNIMARNLRQHHQELASAYSKLERNYEATRDAYRRLQELDQMKSKFITVGSHELRTPLALIRGYVETIEAGTMGPLTVKQKDKLGIVLDSVDRLAGIVDKSLDFSLIEQGKLITEREPLQLADILNQVADEFSLELPRRGLRFEEDIPSRLPLVSGDRIRLHQVFHNLISNAMDFTPEGGALGMRAHCDHDRENILVEVWDAGTGIPEEELENLFSPFYQVDSPVTRKRPGVGLGLAIAKGITEEHGGSLWVESKPGQGTVFSLSLPTMNGNNGYRNIEEDA